MSNIHNLPNQVLLTTTPDELRKLADKMEQAVKVAVLGQTTIVTVWHGKETELHFSFDQEKCTMENPAGMKECKCPQPEGRICTKCGGFNRYG